jgi:hypothetical protein
MTCRIVDPCVKTGLNLASGFATVSVNGRFQLALYIRGAIPRTADHLIAQNPDPADDGAV